MYTKIKLENVTYIYDKKTKYEHKALNDINLEINAGDFVRNYRTYWFRKININQAF